MSAFHRPPPPQGAYVICERPLMIKNNNLPQNDIKIANTIVASLSMT